MPFNDPEKVRAAIEKAVRDELEATGASRFAMLGNDDIEFHVRDDGTIVVYDCLDDDEIDDLPPGDHEIERTLRFRVSVTLVECSAVSTHAE